jgi:hypothetical protein
MMFFALEAKWGFLGKSGLGSPIAAALKPSDVSRLPSAAMPMPPATPRRNSRRF